jgi:hypothetical protein
MIFAFSASDKIPPMILARVSGEISAVACV